MAGRAPVYSLPPPELTDAYLDDRRSQVIDHTTGLLREFDKDLEQTAREQAVLDCLARGLPYKQIGDELGISINTIRTHLRHIYEKLHVQSRTEAVAKYLRR